MARLNIQFFGMLTQVCDTAECAIDIDAFPVRVDTALTRLADAYPQLAQHLPHVACAVADRIVTRVDTLDAGDTLVLLPPVSGG